MRTVTVERGQDAGEHLIYEEDEAREAGIEYQRDWRLAEAGDWALTEDGFVIQVLHSGDAGRWRWIRTAIGTYPTSASATFDTEPRECRFRFSGKKDTPEEGGILTAENLVFVTAFLASGDAMFAYRQAYGDDANADTARKLARRLLRSRKIQKEIAKRVGDALERAGVDEDMIVSELAQMARERDPERVASGTRYRALVKLGEMAGIIEQKGSSRQLPPGRGFKGLSDAEYEVVEEEVQGDAPHALPEEPSEAGADED